MDSIRLQAHDMYEMQDYIDAQFGGPGKGFYRIVTNPFQARQVINAGKMAVVMGIETSVPFGCTLKLDDAAPAATSATSTASSTRCTGWACARWSWSTSSTTRSPASPATTATVGALVNAANFLRDRLASGTCGTASRPTASRHDRNQVAAPEISRRAAGRALRRDRRSSSTRRTCRRCRLYPPPDHCNARGLTTLGEHTIDGLAKRHMIFDPDHMSVEGARRPRSTRSTTLGYHGVVSSHSWSTPDAYPRIYREGGFITPYAGDSTGFVEKWRTARRLGRPALLLRASGTART